MDLVDQQIGELRATFGEVTLTRRNDGTATIEIQKFLLPDGWSARETGIIFIVPVGYPVARPDCFWANADLRLASGQAPANATPNTNHGGPDQRLWFSWHPSSWNPNADSLLTFANVIRRRFQELR